MALDPLPFLQSTCSSCGGRGASSVQAPCRAHAVSLRWRVGDRKAADPSRDPSLGSPQPLFPPSCTVYPAALSHAGQHLGWRWVTPTRPIVPTKAGGSFETPCRYCICGCGGKTAVGPAGDRGPHPGGSAHLASCREGPPSRSATHGILGHKQGKDWGTVCTWFSVDSGRGVRTCPRPRSSDPGCFVLGSFSESSSSQDPSDSKWPETLYIDRGDKTGVKRNFLVP